MFKVFYVAITGYSINKSKWFYYVKLLDDSAIDNNFGKACFAETILATSTQEAAIKAVIKHYKENTSYNLYLLINLLIRQGYMDPMIMAECLEEMKDYLPTIKKLLLFS